MITKLLSLFVVGAILPGAFPLPLGTQEDPCKENGCKPEFSDHLVVPSGWTKMETENPGNQQGECTCDAEGGGGAEQGEGGEAECHQKKEGKGCKNKVTFQWNRPGGPNSTTVEIPGFLPTCGGGAITLELNADSPNCKAKTRTATLHFYNVAACAGDQVSEDVITIKCGSCADAACAGGEPKV